MISSKCPAEEKVLINFLNMSEFLCISVRVVLIWMNWDLHNVQGIFTPVWIEDSTSNSFNGVCPNLQAYISSSLPLSCMLIINRMLHRCWKAKIYHQWSPLVLAQVLRIFMTLIKIEIATFKYLNKEKNWI